MDNIETLKGFFFTLESATQRIRGTAAAAATAEAAAPV